MKLKTLAATFALAALPFAAQASSLDYVAGQVSWKLAGLSTQSDTTAGTTESTWGIGIITQLLDKNGNTVWSSGQGGEYLTYMFYGATTLSNIPGDKTYYTGATGGVADGNIHFDIYRSIGSNPYANVGGSDAATTGRTAFNQYAGLTVGDLYLSLELAQGYVADNAASGAINESTATLTEDLNNESGKFYANVVGGSHQYMWDTNKQTGADIKATYTMNGNDSASASPFGTSINDPFTSFSVSEPGSLALFGLMLAGLGLFRRKQNS